MITSSITKVTEFRCQTFLVRYVFPSTWYSSMVHYNTRLFAKLPFTDCQPITYA